jgi:hypothetical protein
VSPVFTVYVRFRGTVEPPAVVRADPVAWLAAGGLLPPPPPEPELKMT